MASIHDQRIVNLKDRWQRTNEELQRKRKELSGHLQEEFQFLCDCYLSNSNIYALVWTQYTPYWNDGEECNFEVNTINAFTEAQLKEVLTNPEAAYHDEFEGCETVDEMLTSVSAWILDDVSTWNTYHMKSRWSTKDKDQFANAPEGLKDFLMALHSIPDEIYKDTFGDHSQVIITKHKTTVLEYAHD